MRKIIALLTILVLSKFCVAQTYYVSPTGNDANSGSTVADAFLTLQYASDASQAGDTIQVLAGTYVGFYQSNSGTSTQPIVFLAQPGVIINEPNGTTNDGINLEGANNVVIDGFHVYGVPRAGIRSVVNDGVIIRNNLCDSCGRWGILTGFSENILIESNICSRSVIEHGIYFSNSADNPIIRNNVCRENNANGIHMNGDVSLGGDGIISNALVENNVIYENGVAGGSGINCDGVQNSRIQNNLIYNNHASGISLYQIDGGAGSSGNVVVNNTIVQAADGRWCLNINTNAVNNIAFNNIFYTPHTFRGSIGIDASSLPGFKSNHNVLVDRMSTYGGDSNMPLSQWQASTSLDSNSVLSDPVSLFNDATNENYHLSLTSPAIDLGRTSYHAKAAPDGDLDDMDRSQGAYPDAGAYEYLVPMVVAEILKQPTDWNSIPNDVIVSIYDLSCKLLTTGTKGFIDATISNNALMLFRAFDPSTKSFQNGWVGFPR